MTNFTLMRGISGSGKSTFARNLQRSQGGIVVSRDDLRLSLYDTAFGPPINEEFITQVEFHTIDQALLQGINVISDNTNLYPDGVIERLNLGYALNAVLHIEETPISLADALENNRKRGASGGRFVLEHVISKQEHAFYEHQEAVHEILQRYLPFD